MMLPPESPKSRRALKASWKTAAWIYAKVSARRTARAIASNAQAITAVTAVVGTGVAGYGVAQVQSVKHDVSGLTTRLATAEENAAFAKVGVTNLRDSVARLDTKNAKQLKALAKQLTATADQIHHLVSAVAALPPAPSLAPLTARVADLAKTTKDSARKAELATVAAAEQHDEVARAAAADAFAHASSARAVAEKAEKDALAADAKAQALLVKQAENEVTLANLRRDVDFAVATVMAANGSAVDADVTAHLADAKAAEAIARARYNEFVRINCTEPDLCPSYDEEYGK